MSHHSLARTLRETTPPPRPRAPRSSTPTRGTGPDPADPSTQAVPGPGTTPDGADTGTTRWDVVPHDTSGGIAHTALHVSPLTIGTVIGIALALLIVIGLVAMRSTRETAAVMGVTAVMVVTILGIGVVTVIAITSVS